MTNLKKSTSLFSRRSKNVEPEPDFRDTLSNITRKGGAAQRAPPSETLQSPAVIPPRTSSNGFTAQSYAASKAANYNAKQPLNPVPESAWIAGGTRFSVPDLSETLSDPYAVTATPTPPKHSQAPQAASPPAFQTDLHHPQPTYSNFRSPPPSFKSNGISSEYIPQGGPVQLPNPLRSYPPSIISTNASGDRMNHESDYPQASTTSNGYSYQTGGPVLLPTSLRGHPSSSKTATLNAETATSGSKLVQHSTSPRSFAPSKTSKMLTSSAKAGDSYTKASNEHDYSLSPKTSYAPLQPTYDGVEYGTTPSPLSSPARGYFPASPQSTEPIEVGDSGGYGGGSFAQAAVGPQGYTASSKTSNVPSEVVRNGVTSNTPTETVKNGNNHGASAFQASDGAGGYAAYSRSSNVPREPANETHNSTQSTNKQRSYSPPQRFTSILSKTGDTLGKNRISEENRGHAPQPKDSDIPSDQDASSVQTIKGIPRYSPPPRVTSRNARPATFGGPPPQSPKRLRNIPPIVTDVSRSPSSASDISPTQIRSTYAPPLTAKKVSVSTISSANNGIIPLRLPEVVRSQPASPMTMTRTLPESHTTQTTQPTQPTEPTSPKATARTQPLALPIQPTRPKATPKSYSATQPISIARLHEELDEYGPSSATEMPAYSSGEGGVPSHHSKSYRNFVPSSPPPRIRPLSVKATKYATHSREVSAESSKSSPPTSNPSASEPPMNISATTHRPIYESAALEAPAPAVPAHTTYNKASASAQTYTSNFEPPSGMIKSPANPTIQPGDAPDPEKYAESDIATLSGGASWSVEKEKILFGPYDYLFAHPGKDIRSQLIAAFDEWLRVPPASLRIITHVIGMLHTASLLVDDVEDSSLLRRGLPVAHSIFGTAQTINSANYVYFVALQELMKLNNPKAIEIYTEELLNLHRGQGMDLFWRDTLTCPSEEDYLEMVGNKTGGLFRLAVKLMQIESKSSRDHTPLVSLIGTIFQIRDDYLNLSSATYTTNKGLCEDLTEGKFSFPIIHSIRSDPTNLQLINILKQKTTDDGVKRYAVKYMESTGSFDYCRVVLGKLMEKARLWCEESRRDAVKEHGGGRGSDGLGVLMILEKMMVE